MQPPSYQSKAWLLDGLIDSLPGLLRFAYGELTYTVFGPGTFSHAKLVETVTRRGHPREAADAIMEGAPFALIRASAADIARFAIPWYYFKGGAKIDMLGSAYRFSFLRPQNTKMRPEIDDLLREWVGGEGHFQEIAEGRAAGKAWEALFAQVLA